MSNGPAQTYAVEVSHLSKTFGSIRALDNVSLTVEPGEMVALIGASGSGKSTLLRHLAGLTISDESDSYIRVLGYTLQLRGDITTRVRRIRAEIGFIFQQFNLVGRLSLITNVMTGMLARIPIWRSFFRWFTQKEKTNAMQALDQVGMADHAGQRASTLSGGQQQRAAIARTLVQKARLLLADEPIASLDPESSRKVMRTLQRINRVSGITVMVSLHQVDYAMQYCSRCIGMKDGRIEYDGPTTQLTTAILRDIYGTEYADVEEGIDIYCRMSQPDTTTPVAANA